MIETTVKIGQVQIRSGAFLAGLIVVVIGALLFAEGVASIAGGTPFMFSRSLNREFELIVGLVAILLGAAVMGLSRSQLTQTPPPPPPQSTGQPQG